jgi:hypothetical protein
MEKRIISILVLSLSAIVFYINFDGKMNEHVNNLIYYCQYYVLVGLLVILLWILFKNIIIRILTIPISIYYAFHFLVQTIEIFSPKFKELIYTTTAINYILSISLGLSMFISMIFFYKSQKKK